MERSMARSGVRLRSQTDADNQRTLEGSVDASSPQDRGQDILLRLLKQIVEFLERKEMMSTRVAASKEWRKSRSRRRSESSNNLFEVVIQVCEQRVRRLKRSTSGFGRDQEHLSAQSPRVLVAEAIVQELLVSLMELRMKEKETLVMDEVENVEIMRQLHVHLQKDEEMVRNRVCVGAGDEQQLEELQLMLRTDFLEEVASADSPQKQQQVDSAANNEASLQFAWETIDDQKKEIIRLRADNEELQRSTSTSEASSALRASFFDDEPTRVINLLRSQLSSHHDKNLDILQDHIQRLEKALQRATATSRNNIRSWDGSRSTINSCSEKDKWSSTLSRSAIGTDFSRTQIPRRKCEECRKSSALLLTIRSEVKQLRAHAATDEESLLQAEKDRGQLHRENAALSTALLSAKQKQEELRQMILDLTQEKHQLQNLSDQEQRTSERTIHLLKEQLGALEEQKVYQKRKFDELVGKYDSEIGAKRKLSESHVELQDSHEKLQKSATELQSRVASLEEVARRCNETLKGKDSALQELQAQLESIEQHGKSQTLELQEKRVLVANLTVEIANLQLQLEKLEEEKRKMTGENERLLQTLDECKRKNQRLEKGFEELKQGKELLSSLQKVERGASALQLSELQQAREQITSLKLQLSSTKTECIQLEQTVFELKKNHERLEKEGKSQAQNVEEMKRMRHELEVLQQDRMILKTKVNAQQALHTKLEAMDKSSREQFERINNLSQELNESKTAMLMWMNKYNAACEDKERLKSDVQGLSEEQYSLQRQVEGLQADRDAADLAKKFESQAKEESGMELQNEILSLKEQHRSMERERRVMDQEKKSLIKLVQTLQARPELQQRAFREMLISCQRGTERTFGQLSERVELALNKLNAVEKRYQTLKSCVVLCKQLDTPSIGVERSTTHESGHRTVLKPVSPQIVVQDEDFLSSSKSAFDVSVAQPVWLEVLAPFDDIQPVKDRYKQIDASSRTGSDQDTSVRSKLADLVKHWKWKFFAQCLVTHSSKQEVVNLVKQIKGISKTNERLKKTVGRLAWQTLVTKVESRHVLKLHHLGAVLTLRLSNTEMSKRAQYFTHWKDQIRLETYQKKLCASAKDSLRPAFSPTTTIALGSCIQLLRQFCEPTRKEETGSGGAKVKPTHVRGSNELTGYLVEINSKVSSWKLAVDRKLIEYAERNSQLRSLQRRCSELKDLVGLNQRLIEEMERKAAGQQSIVEAAWDFATAYKALSPSARAQVFQSRDFLSASKGLVEGLDSLGMSRSVQKLSQTLGASRHSAMLKQKQKASIKKPNFLSASAAPGISSISSSPTTEVKDKSRERLNDSNIELLEDAVGSLKGAMQKQRALQRVLKEKEHSLTVTTKELERRNMQFLLLRSFLQWKCSSRNSLGVRRTNRQQPTTAH